MTLKSKKIYCDDCDILVKSLYKKYIMNKISLVNKNLKKNISILNDKNKLLLYKLKISYNIIDINNEIKINKVKLENLNYNKKGLECMNKKIKSRNNITEEEYLDAFKIIYNISLNPTTKLKIN